MPLYYLDASSAAKLYLQESGSAEMVRLVGHPDAHQLAILAITVVEFRSAIRRRQRAGELEAPLAVAALESFRAQLGVRIEVLPVNDTVFQLAEELIDRHPLKASDSIQLAGCLMLRTASAEPPAFAASDRQLVRAAEGEGLTIFDPAA